MVDCATEGLLLGVIFDVTWFFSGSSVSVAR